MSKEKRVAPLMDAKEMTGGLVADVKLAIDRMHENSESAKEYIRKLAAHLDAIKECEQHLISVTIKRLLKDKIDEGKITPDWIEECLPREFKRKYRLYNSAKSGLTPLSSEKKEEIVENIEIKQPNGTSLLLKPEEDEKEKHKGNVEPRITIEMTGDIPEVSSVVYTVTKAQCKLIEVASGSCQDACFLWFDPSTGYFLHVEPDVERSRK